LSETDRDHNSPETAIKTLTNFMQQRPVGLFTPWMNAQGFSRVGLFKPEGFFDGTYNHDPVIVGMQMENAAGQMVDIPISIQWIQTGKIFEIDLFDLAGWIYDDHISLDRHARLGRVIISTEPAQYTMDEGTFTESLQYLRNYPELAATGLLDYIVIQRAALKAAEAHKRR
jgi:hypothetical protein